MAVVNQVSAQLTLLDAGKVVAQSSEGKPFRRYFNVPTLAGDATSTIRLAKIYKDERLVGGRVAAVIAGATSATLSIGTGLPNTGVVVGAADRLMVATAIDSALNADFNHTPALAFGELQTVDGEIIATVNTAALLVSKAIGGYIDVLRSW